MRVSLLFARFSAALVLSMTTTRATTVYPEERNCPVCRESFITQALGSYSNFGEPERDLSDSPVFLFGGVEMCPYCLFASLKSDFDDVSARERARIRTITGSSGKFMSPLRQGGRMRHEPKPSLSCVWGPERL